MNSSPCGATSTRIRRSRSTKRRTSELVAAKLRALGYRNAYGHRQDRRRRRACAARAAPAHDRAARRHGRLADGRRRPSAASLAATGRVSRLRPRRPHGGAARRRAAFQPDGAISPARSCLIFQPAEETGGGALAMLADGLLAALSLRRNLRAAQRAALRAGHVRRARRRHARLVRRTEDQDRRRRRTRFVAGEDEGPVIAAAQLICALQTVVSRSTDPSAMAVLSIGSIHAGTTSNVIPSHAELLGTLRTFDETIRAQAKAPHRNDLRGHGDRRPNAPLT